MRTLALGLLLLGACTVDSPPSDLSSTERAWVDDGLPALQASCTVCHQNVEAPDNFLAGETAFEIRVRLLDSGVVDLQAAPDQTLLLTKGMHAGPALSADQADALIRWLHTERSSQP